MRIALMSLVLLCASCAPSIADPPALATLDGTQWSLRSWDQGDPAPAEPPITLTYAEGGFAGRSGCNSYNGSVQPGDLPGAISVGPVVSTRMACPEMQMDVETRYLTNLQAVTKFGILAGDLALTYQDESGEERTMRFAPRAAESPGDSRP